MNKNQDSPSKIFKQHIIVKETVNSWRFTSTIGYTGSDHATFKLIWALVRYSTLGFIFFIPSKVCTRSTVVNRLLTRKGKTRRKSNKCNLSSERNKIFAPNSNFLIPISLEPDIGYALIFQTFTI